MIEPSDSGKIRVSSREALRFLAAAGRILSSSLDTEKTLTRVVDLAVPRIACFAMIDLVREGDRMERVGFRHVDPAAAGVLERSGPFGVSDADVLPIAQVLATGSPFVIRDVAHDWHGSDVVLKRMQLVGARSLIIVPLEAHRRRLGTLTFGSTRTDRFYGKADVSLAQELARSAAMALENARLYADAEHAISARDDVLAIVSHDLRNPVNRVGLAAEMILETEALSQTGKKSVEIIARAAHEMNRLIGDLLDASRIDSGNLSIQTAPMNLVAFMHRVDESFAPAAHERQLDWRVDIPADATSVIADEDRLLQALGNLIGNAIKFTPASGTVRVDAQILEDTVRIGVHDTGPGMDEQQLSHVFDRFWQARSGDRRGAGLGLAIARGIVLAHGGRLCMESAPGAGTSAWIQLER